MEITQILSTQSGDIRAHQISSQSREAEAAIRAQAAARTESAARAEAAARAAQNQDLTRAVEELRRVSQVFNRRLSFKYNEDLNQVIVKVIDRETDKVIKELPPDALQRVHMRIKEAIGLLFDETV